MLSPLSNDQQMSPLSTPGSVYPWQKLEEREFDEIHSLVYTEINSWKTPLRERPYANARKSRQGWVPWP